MTVTSRVTKLTSGIKTDLLIDRDSPRNAIILNNLGTVMLLLDDEEGITMLEEALALKPTSVDIMTNVGLQCQESGDLERARDLYLRQVGPRCLPGSNFARSGT